jgi:hypothetical protein
MKPLLPDEHVKEDLGDAIKAAMNVEKAAQRTDLLCKLANRLPENERPRLLLNALAAVHQIHDLIAQTKALAWLASKVATEQRQEVIAVTLERLKVKLTGKDEPAAAEILCDLAQGGLVKNLFKAALKIARGLKDHEQRVRALAALAQHAPTDVERDQIARSAYRSLLRIGRSGWTKALPWLASLLPQDLLRDAVDRAEHIPGERWINRYAGTVNWLRALAAAPLPPDLWNQAVTIANKLKVDGYDSDGTQKSFNNRDNAIAGLIEYCPDSCLSKAVTLAMTCDPDLWRIGGLSWLTQLEPRTRGNDRDEVLLRILQTRFRKSDYSTEEVPLHISMPFILTDKSLLGDFLRVVRSRLGHSDAHRVEVIFPYLSPQQQEETRGWLSTHRMESFIELRTVPEQSSDTPTGSTRNPESGHLRDFVTKDRDELLKDLPDLVLGIQLPTGDDGFRSIVTAIERITRWWP